MWLNVKIPEFSLSFGFDRVNYGFALILIMGVEFALVSPLFALVINYFSRSMNKDSKYFQEMTLDYALVQKDIQLFWPRFIQYAMLNKDKNMPIHYQEAAYLYGKLEPQTMDISQMPFDKQQIVERYERFNQTAQSLINSRMDSKQVGEAMKSTYGDTFWWFYFFCRDITSY